VRNGSSDSRINNTLTSWYVTSSKFYLQTIKNWFPVKSLTCYFY